jgi:hypothetical protein
VCTQETRVRKRKTGDTHAWLYEKESMLDRMKACLIGGTFPSTVLSFREKEAMNSMKEI